MVGKLVWTSSVAAIATAAAAAYNYRDALLQLKF